MPAKDKVANAAPVANSTASASRGAGCVQRDKRGVAKAKVDRLQNRTEKLEDELRKLPLEVETINLLVASSIPLVVVTRVTSVRTVMRSNPKEIVPLPRARAKGRT